MDPSRRHSDTPERCSAFTPQDREQSDVKGKVLLSMPGTSLLQACRTAECYCLFIIKMYKKI